MPWSHGSDNEDILYAVQTTKFMDSCMKGAVGEQRCSHVGTCMTNLRLFVFKIGLLIFKKRPGKRQASGSNLHIGLEGKSYRDGDTT